MVQAIIMVSGGLDSLLTVKLMEKSHISFKVVHFDLGLTYNKPIVAGQRISKYFGLEDLIKNKIEIDKIDLAKEFYTELLNIQDFSHYNACTEMKVFLMKKAKEYMKAHGAQFIVCGDVLEQRPVVQGKDAIHYIDTQAEIEDIIFRPLSGKLLPLPKFIPHFPQLVAIMHDFTGFSPKREKLAKRLHILYNKITPPQHEKESELDMGKKAFEIFEKQRSVNLSHLTRVGIHYKLGNNLRCVIGRTPFESNYLKYFYQKIEQKLFSFSSETPRFLFGFLYGSSYSPEQEQIALQIFSFIIGANNSSNLITLYDSDSLPLGNQSIVPININKVQKFILHSNELFCPICPIEFSEE